jgi:hypothetical protein
MRLARTGVGAVRAERLRRLASAEGESADAAGAVAGPGAGAAVGSTIQLRLIFPDRVTVVAVFGALESCDALRETAAACLAGDAQPGRIRLSVMRPGGGTKTLRGSSALALAGLRHRGTVSVKLDGAEGTVYCKAVADAVAVGGAAVDLA